MSNRPLSESNEQTWNLIAERLRQYHVQRPDPQLNEPENVNMNIDWYRDLTDLLKTDAEQSTFLDFVRDAGPEQTDIIYLTVDILLNK